MNLLVLKLKEKVYSGESMKVSRSSQKVKTRKELLEILADIALVELIKIKQPKIKGNKNAGNTKLLK